MASGNSKAANLVGSRAARPGGGCQLRTWLLGGGGTKNVAPGFFLGRGAANSCLRQRDHSGPSFAVGSRVFLDTQHARECSLWQEKTILLPIK